MPITHSRRPRRSAPLGVAVILLPLVFLFSTAAAETKPFQIEEASISSIQQAILAKKITTVGVVKLYLARIKAYNGQSVEMPQGLLGPITTIPHAGQLNALSTLNLRPAHRKEWGFDDHHARSNTDPKDADPNMPDALEVAAREDEYFRKTGKLVGPLHGVVMAVKDQYDTFDLRTTGGADVDWANDRPPRDGEFVTRLRKAGAIILAKSNLGEYASGIPRSSWGGVFSNPYDTERSPMGSSSGSGIAVAANLVTCAIGEETGTSIRGPSCFNNCVGIAGTQELVSRDGMMGAGTNTRCGPICRTVEDAARILSVIAGYDPKDPYTAFGIGRLPDKPYQEFAHEKSLKGVRIGVVREYMEKSLFTKADEENIDLINAAIEDLRKLGAEIVDPGPEGLFTPYLRRYWPMLTNATYAKRQKELFPVDGDGKSTTDQIATLVDLAMDPAKAPALTIRDLGQAQAVGESPFMMQLYVARRGDAAIKTTADLLTKARFFEGKDQFFGDRKLAVEQWSKPGVLDTAVRMQHRFAVQQVILAAMADLKLDVCIYPTNNLPAHKLGQPTEPTKNGRPEVWSFFGGQGFPTMTVPAGFTSHVYDRVEDPNGEPPPPVEEGARGAGQGVKRVPTRLVGPVAAALPVGLDVMGRPFSEPMMLKVASAYEAATHHRKPPADFGPVKNGAIASTGQN